MPANTTYLITGANRGNLPVHRLNDRTSLTLNPSGIGKHLLITYLSRPGTTVIAGVRDPTGPSSKSLRDLPKGDGSDVIVVKIDSASEKDAAIAVAEMQSSHNIMKVDVVIANAGISKDYQPVVSATVMQVQEHVSVNAIGPFVLFQSVYRLLQKSANPKFVVVSSAAGSIGGMESRPFPMFAYGASKAMANYLVRKIHCEHEDITSFAVDPGSVIPVLSRRFSEDLLS